MPAVARLRAPAPAAEAVLPVRPVSRARARVRLFYPGALIAVLAAALILLFGNSAAPGPATGAATVVPADALAYIHVSTDPARGSVKRALAIAERFPAFSSALRSVQTRLAAITGHPGDFEFGRDAAPWLGNEAALAFLTTSDDSTAQGLIVLAVRNRPAALAMLAHSGAGYAGSYRGVRIYSLSGATMLALVHGYLVIGSGAGVDGAIDAGSGDGPSLASARSYIRSGAGEPADRVLDAYLSPTGVQRLLVPWGGVLGALGTMVDRPNLAGVAISLSPASGGARIRIHSAFTHAIAAAGKPIAFAPTLQAVIPSGSALMLDLSGLDHGGAKLLRTAAVGGVAARVAPLLSRLGAALTAEGVDVADLLSVFHGETAIAIGSGGNAAAPSLIVVTRVRDEARARARLAAVEGPLLQLFQPPDAGAGQAAVLDDQTVLGTTVHELALGPGLRLDYAVAHGLVIIATSLAGVTSVLERSRALVEDPLYHATMPNRPHGLTSLVFLDLRQLLSLGEQTGLMRGVRYQALRPDLEKVRAIRLESTSGETDSTAELFLQIP